jgi:hypothetical protein
MKLSELVDMDYEELRQLNPDIIAEVRSRFVGKRVLNVRRDIQGTVLNVESGCNGLVLVQFDHLEFNSWQCWSDIALVDTYPKSRFGLL